MTFFSRKTKIIMASVGFIFLFLLKMPVQTAFVFPQSCVNEDPSYPEVVNYYFITSGLTSSKSDPPLAIGGSVVASDVEQITCVKYRPQMITDVPIRELFDAYVLPQNLLLSYNNGDTKFAPGYQTKETGHFFHPPYVNAVNSIDLHKDQMCDGTPCVLFYYIYDSNLNRTGSLYFLGREGDELAGDFSWSISDITLQKGQIQTVEITASTTIQGLPNVTISCDNCEANSVQVAAGTLSHSIKLTIDSTKIKENKIILKAKSDGPISFVSSHQLNINQVDVTCGSLSQPECTQNSFCFPFNNKCYAKTNQSICPQLPQNLCGSAAGSTSCVWLATGQCSDAASASYASSYEVPKGYSGPLPDCAFQGTCRNVNDLIQLAINIGKFLLGLIGSVALFFFVYGGFMMIISMGNADRVKHGKDILVAAVIGIVIAFSAYLLIDFVLDALNVSTEYRIVEQQ